MILSRYFDENGLDTLTNLRLKVSAPNKLNDPFEFLPYVKNEISEDELIDYIKTNQSELISRAEVDGLSLNKNQTRESLTQEILLKTYIDDIKKGKMKDEINKVFHLKKNMMTLDTALLCFTDASNLTSIEDILMWSHYSSSHKGIRITFDYNELIFNNINQLKKVNYDKTRIEIKFSDFTNTKKLQNTFFQALITKNEIWKYENEYRVFFSLNKCFAEKIKEKILHFISIPSSAIIKVDIGLNCTSEFRNIILEQLKDKKYAHVKKYDAKIHDKKYEIKYEPI